MKKKLLLAFSILSLIFLTLLTFREFLPSEMTGAPPYGESEEEIPQLDRSDMWTNWQRPEGPAKVGLQVGHWKNEELPEELHRLVGNTGASGGGKAEWEVNYQIATLTAEILRSNGVIVDIIPATVPPQYLSDVFVAIHADGNTDQSVTGFKVAAPWRDLTGKAALVSKAVESSYQKATGFIIDPNVTRNMRGYYAFSWWRYEHAIHPMTTAMILETGFLTNPNDQKIIVKKPEIASEGLADGLLTYLSQQGLLDG